MHSTHKRILFFGCIAGFLLIPMSRLQAQTRVDLMLNPSYSSWGSQLYSLDGLGRGSGWSIRPAILLRSGRFVFGAEGERGTYNFNTDLFQYEFYNAESVRSLWQVWDAEFTPVRTNFEVLFGVTWGRSAMVYLAAKTTSVTFNQYLYAEQFQYISSTATWKKIEESEVPYNRKNSRTWIGLGCNFQLPVYYRQFTLDGTVRYYVINEERYNVIYGEALLTRKLSPAISVHAGGRMEFITSAEMLGSVWSLVCGLSYHLYPGGK